MSASRRRALRLAAVLFAALVCALVLAPAPAALAVGPPVLSNPSPAPGIPGLPNTWVSVGVSATGSSPLTGACTLRVDNSVVSAAHWSYAEAGGHWEWDDWYEEDVWVPDYDTTAGWFGYTMRFSNGSHAATVTVTDSAGRTSSYAWTFSVGGPPAVQALSPSDGAVATSPVVPLSAYVVDNYGVLSSVTMWLDGTVVPATYVNKWLRYTPPPLAEGSTHTVTVVAVDSTGPSTTCTWSFLVHAGPPTFAGDAPGPTPPATTWDPTIAVTASDLATLSPPTSYRIDGSPVAGSFAFAPDHHSGTVSIPATMLADGPHTASVTIANVAGTSATHTWGFTVAAPPVAGSQSPAPGSTVSTATPAVSALVKENSPGTITASATVDGIHATATYDPATKKANVTPLVALSDDATHTVALALTDAGGNSSTSVWSFFVQTSPGMPVAGECTASGCHTGYPSGHPVGSCDACHEPGGPLAGCTTCHSSGAHTDSVLSSYDCSYCHGANPTVPTHPADLDAAHATSQDMASCDGTGCHASRLTVEHAARGMTCAGCHDSTDPAVASAISSGTTRCGACHTAGANSGHLELHDIPGVDADCAGSGCHAATNLVPLHGDDCGVCHDSLDTDVVSAISRGDKTCAACHSTADHIPLHDTTVTPSCAGADCHAGSNLTTIHADCDTCHDSTDTRVTAAISGHDKSCTACHTAHPDLTVTHTSTATTATITILATSFGTHSCSECHSSTDVRTLHTNGCSTCHPTLDDTVKPWDKTCAGSSCHSASSSKPMHANVDAGHLVTVPSCVADGCHAGGGNIAAIHTKQGCATCHGAGKTPTANCTASGCHTDMSGHGDVSALHTASVSSETMTFFSDNTDHQWQQSFGSIDTNASCSMCHATTNLAALHANDCALCHFGSSPPRDSFTTWNRTCSQGACHPSYHDNMSAGHDGEYDNGQSCYCHDNLGMPMSYGTFDATPDFCGGCHATGADATPPSSSSDAHASYVGPAVVTVTATDDRSVYRTYYVLDGGATNVLSGTIIVPAPASGSQPHTLEFWSKDYAGNVETTHKTASFTVSVDTAAPVTTSDAAASYVGPVAVHLTATDNATSRGVKTTYYQFDGGPMQSGVTATLPQPASGVETHAVHFWSDDWSGNTEAATTATFTVTADTAAPTSTSSLLPAPKYYPAGKITISFNPSDPSPSSGIAGVHVDSTNPNSWWGDYHEAGYNAAAGAWQLGMWAFASGDYPVQWAARDKAGNVESVKTTTISVDANVPVTTSNVIYGHTYAGTQTFTLNGTDTGGSGVASTWYSIDGAAYTQGASVTVTAPVSGTVYHPLYFYSKDNAGNQENPKYTYLYVQGVADTTPPTGTMSVNNGAVWATSTAASINSTVTDTGSGMSQMRVDPNGTGAYGAWVAYSASYGITLPTGSGTKTVNVQYRDVVGNVLTLSDTIVLDTTAPTGTMAVNNGAAVTATITASVNSTVTDTFSGVSQMRIDPGTGTYGGWTAYAASSPITLPSGDGTKTVNVQYRDNAGNTATLTDTIKLDSTAPDTTPPTTTSSFNPAAGAIYNSARPVTLTASDPGGSGVKNTYYRVDADAYTTGTSFSVSGDGLHTFSYYSTDNGNNTETVHVSNQFRIDTVAPVTSSSVTSGQAYAGDQMFTFSATDGGAGVASTWFKLDSGAWTQGTSVLVGAPGSGSASHTLSWYSVDNATNQEATRSATFTVAYTAAGSRTFNFTGADQSFTVPGGVTSVVVDLYGGQGGEFDGYVGGYGGWVHALVPVTPGQVLTIRVGGGAAPDAYVGAWPNGGNAGHGGGGGGSTSILSGSAVWVEAGAGGGGDHAGSDGGPGGYQGWLPGGNEHGGDADGAAGGGGWNGGSGYPSHEGGGDGGTSYIAVGTGTLTPGFSGGDGSAVINWYGDDSTPPVTTSNALGSYVGPATITLTASDDGGSGVAATYYRVDAGPQQTGTTIVIPPPAIGTQSHTIHFWSVDNMGNPEPENSATFDVTAPPDSTPPAGTMSVNSGAVWATSTAATVNSAVTDSGSGMSQMRIDPGTGTYGGWIAYAAGSAITLPNGDGTKTVNVQYRDLAGNVLTLSDTILLDATGPAGTMSVNNAAVSTSSTAATVNSAVTDSGSGLSQMRIDPGTGTYGSWIAYAASSAITLPTGDGTKTVNVQYRDLAGNVVTLSDTILLDATAPAGAMSVNSGAVWATSTAATVNSAVTDSGSGMSQMRIDPGTGTYGGWIAYAAGSAITLPSGDGTKTVNVQYRDNNGNIATLTDTIRLDLVTPATGSDAGASYTGTATVTLTPTDVGSGVAATYYKLDGGGQTTGTVVTVAPPVSGTTTHTVEFWSVDVAGNGESPHKTATFAVAAPGTVTPGSRTFDFTGADQTFTVPAGVTSIVVDLYGGQGGEFDGYVGGAGGLVHAIVPVTPGQNLTVRVGGGAVTDAYTGAWPNGGDAGHGGGGGGSTSILSGSAVWVEAGAGGGGDHAGSDGGAGGAQGWLPGGNQPGEDADGAAGGGGWNGGAGYPAHEGGGDGGTSYIAVGTGELTPGVNIGDGSAVISWPGSAPGGQVTFSATGANQSFTVPAGVTALTVDLNGSQGGNGGGLGGAAHAAIPVTPGQVLTVKVGDTDGWPNGGAGTDWGGAGGGSSSVLLGSTILAEAGGGGGYANGGNPAGAGGGPGTDPGGNQNGDDGYMYGAGGGGGWNGGGNGGGDDTSGDGGTSRIAVGTGTLAAGSVTGNGSVVISW